MSVSRHIYRICGLIVLAVICCSCVFGFAACDEGKDSINFVLPSYAESMGPKGDGKNGVYSASQGLSYTLSIRPDNTQYYSVEGIGNCTDTNIVIPDTYEGRKVFAISPNAFRNCTQIVSVRTTGVATIGAGAFSGCTRLLHVTLGPSMEIIQDNAFAGCFRLKEVFNQSRMTITKGDSSHGLVGFFAENIYTMEEGKSNLVMSGNYILYRDTERCTLVGMTKSSEYVVVPDIVTEIGEYAFWGDTQLLSVVIPSSVSVVGRFAFKNCSKLITVSMGAVVGIEDEAFYRCYKLNRVTMGESLSYIGRLAFAGCSNLGEFNMPDSLQHIGEYAFSNCIKLRNVSVSRGVTQLDCSIFEGCKNLNNLSFAMVERWHITSDLGGFIMHEGGAKREVTDPNANAVLARQGQFYWYRG